MLQYFRLNDPYRLIALMALMLLAAIPHLVQMPPVTLLELKSLVLGEEIASKLLYVRIIDDTPPLMALTDGLLNLLFGRSILIRHLLTLFLLFIQASYFAIILINNKAYNETNYVPALIFGFLCFFSFDVLSLTPELFASFFLLLGLDNLFREIEFRVEKDSLVLNLGIFVGISSLFVFSYTIFLLGSLVILVFFARATIRKVALLLFGFALVHAILWTVYYAYDHNYELWIHFYKAQFTTGGANLMSTQSILWLGALPGVYFVISLFMLTREARFTRYQTQLFQTIFVWLLFAVVQVWMTSSLTPHQLITLIPPLTYFISHYLLLIRRKRIAESMMLILIAGLLSVHYGAYRGNLEPIDYRKLFLPEASVQEAAVMNKKVMMLDDNLAIFEKNKMAGDFLNWTLSKKYFMDTDDYENIIRIREAILLDPPDVIVDPHDVMQPVMKRIPEVRIKYRRRGELYELF